jgi:hypothetical protein
MNPRYKQYEDVDVPFKGKNRYPLLISPRSLLLHLLHSASFRFERGRYRERRGGGRETKE